MENSGKLEMRDTDKNLNSSACTVDLNPESFEESFSLPLDLFIQTVGSLETYTMVPQNRLACMNMNKERTVQILDATQCPIISVTKLAGRSIVTYESDVEGAVEFGTSLELKNSSGQILLRGRDDIQILCPCLQSRALCSVYAGEQLLGSIERSFFCNSNLTAYSHGGDKLFQSVREPKTNSTNIVAHNGVLLGRVVKSTNASACAVEIIDSQNVDPKTKALLVFSIYLFVSQKINYHS